MGPLEPLLQDPGISDILVNGYRQVYVERKGLLELTGVRFHDDGHLLRIIDKIVSQVGRRVDESNPMVDARLLDGSRVNAIIPPLAVDGPLLSIRRFGTDKLMPDDLVRKGALTARHDAAARGRGSGQAQHYRVRRHGGGEDDPFERPLRIHFAEGTDRDDRRCGGVATETAAFGAPGNQAREPRRIGRRPPAAIAGQQLAHAAGSHHRGRGSRRGGARHAAGNEYRARRLADDGSREHPARRGLEAGGDGDAGEREHAFDARYGSRSPRPSTSWCSARA